MFKMICPNCKSRMNDNIEFFNNEDVYLKCTFCNASLKVSNVYRNIGMYFPTFIIVTLVMFRRSFYTTIIERFLVQPIVATLTIIIFYILYRAIYPRKLKLNNYK